MKPITPTRLCNRRIYRPGIRSENFYVDKTVECWGIFFLFVLFSVDIFYVDDGVKLQSFS